MHELIRVARSLGVDPEWYLREYFQRAILHGISSLNFVDYYVLQGGTALRIAYGSPRFSLDLDFTVINRHISQLGGDVATLVGFLNRFFSIYGLDVRKSREKIVEIEGFYRCLITFDTLELLGRKTRIRLELVIRQYQNVKFRREIVTMNYPVRTAFGIQIKTPEQILVDKLCSLAGGIHRGYIRWRDIFDIYWLVSRHNARVDMHYFQQEFGSWVENIEDLKRLHDMLVEIQNQRSYGDIIDDLRKVLRADLVDRHLIDTYLRTAISSIEQVISNE